MRSIKTSSGFSLIDILMASLIISVAAAGLGVAVNSSVSTRQKLDVVNNMVAVESLLIEQLQNPDVFKEPTYIAALTKRDLTTFRSQFVLSMPEWGNAQFRLTGPTAATRYRRNGSVCSAGCTDWIFQLSFDIRETSSSPNPPAYAFAYNLSANPEVASMPSMGMPQPFTTASYQIVLPAKSFLGDDTCDASTDVGMTGFNFQTGQAICLHKPTLSCPLGSFASGLKTFPETGTEPPLGLEYSCQRIQKVECPLGYALTLLKPAELDIRNHAAPVTDKAACVFMAVDQENSPTGVIRAESGISGTFCHNGYDALIVSCRGYVARTDKTPDPCPVGAPVGACPLIEDGAWYGAPATYEGSPVPPYIPPAHLRAIASRPGGRNTASCVLNNPPQASGAGWTGYVELEVRCVRQTPGVGGSPADWGYQRIALPRIVDE